MLQHLKILFLNLRWRNVGEIPSSGVPQICYENTLELLVAHSAVSPSLTLVMCSSFLAAPLSCPSTLLSCKRAPCIFLQQDPVRKNHVFFLLLHHSGAEARISCLWLCKTVECLFSAESLTMFTSIKLSFFPSIWEAVRMGQ